MTDPVSTLLSQIEAEIKTLPSCELFPASAGAALDERLADCLGKDVPPGVAAFFRAYDGGAFLAKAGAGEADGDSQVPEHLRRARLLTFEESVSLIERGGPDLKGLWPFLQRGGQLLALDADVPAGKEWPVVQLADRSVDRLGTSLLRFLHVLCAELAFDDADKSLLDLVRTRCKRDPHLSEHWVDLAETLAQEGEGAEAEAVLAEGARCADPVGPSLLAAIGLAKLLDGDKSAARGALEDAMACEPLTARDDDSRLDAAALLFLIGEEDGDRALAQRAQSVLKDAVEATAGYWRGEAVRALGAADKPRAFLALRLVTALLPEDGDAKVLGLLDKKVFEACGYLSQAREALEMGDLPGATKHSRAAVSRLPELALAHATVAEALNMTHNSDALGFAKKATELNPCLVDAWRELGDAHFEKRAFDDALLAYDEGLKRDHTYGLLHAKRSQVLLELGRRIESLEAIGDAAQYGGDAFFLAAVKGDVYSAMDRSVDAAESYEQALVYEPEDHWVLHQAALEHSRSGNNDRSAELFDLALTHDRDGCHQTLVDYAQLMQKMGRIGDAVRLYRRAVAAVPQDPSWRASLKEAEKELAAAPN